MKVSLWIGTSGMKSKTTSGVCDLSYTCQKQKTINNKQQFKMFSKSGTATTLTFAGAKMVCRAGMVTTSVSHGARFMLHADALRQSPLCASSPFHVMLVQESCPLPNETANTRARVKKAVLGCMIG